MNNLKTVEVPVLIVGGGPAGLTTSLLLSQYGINNLLINKYRWTANSPRAHITNQRTMEVFRDAQIEEQVKEVATPRELMANNIWATSFAGDEIARLLSWGNAIERKADYEQSSPSSMCNIAQHVMEPVIANAALRAGSSMRFNNEFLDFSQDAEGVTARILDHITGEEYLVRAKYMIGADGARSKIVDQLELPLSGQHGLGCAVNVWLKADLTEYCVHRPGVLYWIVQPGSDYWVGSGTFICVKPWKEWVMTYMYDPAEGEPDLSIEAITKRAYQVIGDKNVPIEIISTSKWQINRVVADRYSKGRVFCMGDAVHRHPPANGLGSNTSVQDAFNLAWKIALVLKGQAGEGLLETYQQERQPVGVQLVDRAMRSVENMLPIANALGFKSGQSKEEGQAALDLIFGETPESHIRRAELHKAIELQHYQFNCNGVQIGQRYQSKAVIPDVRPEPKFEKDKELYYQPTTWSGARLPHVWLHDKRGRQLSSLDLCGRGSFTLLTGHGGDLWKQAVEEISTQIKCPIKVVKIGLGLDYADTFGDWESIRDIDENGCVLVRPDHHISLRVQTPDANPAQQLLNVMKTILDV